MLRRVLVAMALSTLACGGEDDSDPPGLGAAPLHPVPGCERVDHRACDTSSSGCRTRLMKIAACVRGNDPSDVPAPPPVSTMTEAEFAAYLNQWFVDNPQPEPNHYENALVLLDLAAPGTLGQQAVVAEEVKYIGGIYRSDTKDIVLVEHEKKLDPTRNSILLVHEYIHALQDLDVGLDAFRDEHATSTDALTAVRALVEGEARLHESRYAAAVLGLDPASIDWKMRFAETIDSSMKEIAEGTSVYGPAYRDFAYTWGARYAELAFEQGGLAEILVRYASPAVTTRTVMASVDTVLADEPRTEIAAPAPPAEWTPFTDTSLGALGVYLFTERLTRLPATSLATALAWRNDHVFVFASTSTTDTALVWYLDFATEGDASLFVERLGTTFQPAQAGTRVTVARARSGVALPWASMP
jgi:hypothetical protein